jgi:hypothetical protein
VWMMISGSVAIIAALARPTPIPHPWFYVIWLGLPVAGRLGLLLAPALTWMGGYYGRADVRWTGPARETQRRPGLRSPRGRAPGQGARGRCQADYSVQAREIRDWNHTTAVAMLTWLDTVTRTRPRHRETEL